MQSKNNNITSRKRVVVTGIGVLTSIGIGLKNFWKAVKSGKNGISRVSSFNTDAFRTHRAGEIKNFRPEKFMDSPEKKGRATQLLLAAVKLALLDSKIKLSDFNPYDIATIVGITALEPKELEKINDIRLKKGDYAVPASLVESSTTRASSVVAARMLGACGPNVIIPTACAAGNYAIGYGYDLLRQKRAKVAFCCGADAFSRVIFTGFNRFFAVAPDNCMPFDKKRKGMITAEGSGVLILETLESALSRKAVIYAEVSGYGLSCDAYSMTAPSKDGIKKVMERAIKNSGIKKEDVDYINAHGTGTINNDKAEAAAIREVFGKRTEKIYVSSIKSMIGHTLGAAPAIEAAACCMAIKENIIPPNINYHTPDPECDINIAANKPVKMNVNVVMNNSFAFGGNNASVVFSKLKNAH